MTTNINPGALASLRANAIEGNCLSVREYAEAESQSDPSFFRWFFQNEELEDFENQDPAVFDKWLLDNDETITFDVIFNDDVCSNSKGFRLSKQDCLDYIKNNNGTSESYFDDYKGGTVQVECNETGQIYYSEIVR